MPDPFSTIPNAKVSLVDALVSERLLTHEQARQVKLKSATEGIPEEKAIESLNLIKKEEIEKAKAKSLGLPFISLGSSSFSPQALGFIPFSVAERFSLIPFAYDDKLKTLSVAMSNATDLEAISFIRRRTGLNIKVFAAEKNDVEQAISVQYRQGLVGEVGEALKESVEVSEKVHTYDTTQISQTVAEAPIAKIVSTILDYAMASRSSDIHVEPQEDRIRVRYRIDGILYDKLSLPKNVQDSVVSRIKIMSDMKIDEHRIPQDGRFNFKTGDKEVDLRISVLPTAHGEKIVMRLLRKSGGIPSLEKLGLSGASLRNLETAILRPHGIIIVCGPTGSGKTTTLYSVLSRLNTTRVNIMTLEDPVEYQITGVNQVAINPAVGLTFATGLRSFLRQDPNIILVGEIRDQETTDLAIQAALTGHLVFSTLHTSNAAGALPRLIDLGAQSFLLASTMNAVLGQRIVRIICDHCKESYIPLPQIVDEMKNVLQKLFPSNKEIKLYKGKGCDECGSSGYLGRIGIFETLPVSEKIIKLISENADSGTIERQAISEGMITMKQDGYLKALGGVTTIEEVIRVAQE
ncbi:MAG: hypothetical protein A2687_02315 [Candidatus Levybacteria bacterium RIFCSPHIGHO2_01_FULL_38_26]|nr:MAG: hypothetical protein A2687_02315 [Candidatus Levybacteria bacterium RIFCSPHIGHO2_01_FULL_38_26]